MQLGMAGRMQSRALTSRISVLSFVSVLKPEIVVVLGKKQTFWDHESQTWIQLLGWQAVSGVSVPGQDAGRAT